MAKDRRIIMSSKEEQKIEKAYLATTQGKIVFTLTFVACFALIVGLLIETYKAAAWNTKFINENSFWYEYSRLLFMWGGIAALIGLFFYIRFAIGFKNTKTRRAPRKAAPKTETKKVAKKETTKKPAAKTSKTTTTKKK